MRHHFVRSSAGLRDPNFKNVTLLLHGDGTNGGQNNTFLDSGPSNFSITRTGNITQGLNNPYGNRWSNYFDGTGDYLLTPANAAFQLGTGDFSIDLWYYPTISNTIARGLFGIGNDAAGAIQLLAKWPFGGNPDNTLALNSTNITTLVADRPFNLNNWNHIAISRASGVASVFLNGTRVINGSFTVNVTFNQLVIGREHTGKDQGYAVGYISDFRLVKGTALYSGTNITVPTSPLSAVSNTSILTCQSNRFRDASSNNFSIEYSRFGNTAISRFNPFDQTSPYIKEIYAGSAYFNGSGGQRLTVDNSSGVSLGGANFTIEGWLFNDEYGTRGLIVKTGSWSIYKWGGNIMGRLTTGGVDASIVDYDHPTGGWMHFAFVRDGDTVRLYLNGVQRRSATFTSVVDSSANNIIIGNDGGFNTLNGFLTGIRVTVGTCLYPSGTTFDVPTGPLSALPDTKLLLNFTNASIVDNAMMNNLETVGNAQISTSVKKYGTGSLYFDGTGDYLQIAATSNLNLSSGDWTVECWWNPSANVAQNIVMINYNAGTDGYAHARISTSVSPNTFYALSSTNGTSWLNVTGGGSWSINNWYHLAFVRNGSTFTLFANGTSVLSYTSSSTLFAANGISEVGRTSSSANQFYYVNGYIDDLRVTKGVARYTSNFTPPTAPFPDF